MRFNQLGVMSNLPTQPTKHYLVVVTVQLLCLSIFSLGKAVSCSDPQAKPTYHPCRPSQKKVETLVLYLKCDLCTAWMAKKIVHCRAEDYRHAADGVSVLSHVRNLEKKGGRVGVAFLVGATFR
jgi:hypothetical protein